MSNSHNNIPEFWETSSSSNGVRLQASPKDSLGNSSQVKDKVPYDILEHERRIHVPIPLFSLSDYPEILSEHHDCLDLPIRLSGQDDYSIPEEWTLLIPIIQKVIDIEHSNNPFWKSYNTYLTIQYSKEIKANVQQRNPGAHTDGLQSIRHGKPALPARNYVAVTNGGTLFYPQTFVANLDLDVFNIFEGFDLQLNRDEDGNKKHDIAEELLMYFFDAYTVHESGVANRDGARLFFRLAWEELRFDRAVNTHNNMLNYNWQPYHGDKRRELVTPTLKDIQDARTIKI